VNRADYDRYLAAFNAKDYDGIADFYAEPINMDFFGVTISSRQGLKDFYSFLHSYVKENVTVLNFASSETLTAVDAIVRVEGIRNLDAEALAAKGLDQFFPIQTSEVQQMRQFIFYTIRDGKIAKVECALVPGGNNQVNA
jgi:hypothetical protein